MTRRIYNKPPLQEVICEILLDQATEWDLAIPGILFGKLQARFPSKESRRVQDVELSQSLRGAALRIRDSERAVFRTEDGKSLVQVGERLLTVNRLRPYTGWAIFKKDVELAYQKLCETVAIKSIQGLALRYIDNIEIPGHQIRVEDYFNFRPQFVSIEEGERLSYWESFIVGIATLLDDGRDRIRMQLGSGIAQEKAGAVVTTFVLETTYNLARAGAVKPDEVNKWFEVAHERIGEVFERAITDELRKLFEPA